MSKEEKIKESWGGSCGGEIDENGWKPTKGAFIPGTLQVDVSISGDFYRPKSLQGIETNNGWSVIPCIHEKEIEKGQYWVVYANGFIEVADYNGTMECYKFWKLNYTHYQPIEKPKPPLF